jgi:hypothetical protein
MDSENMSVLDAIRMIRQETEAARIPCKHNGCGFEAATTRALNIHIAKAHRQRRPYASKRARDEKNAQDWSSASELEETTPNMEELSFLSCGQGRRTREVLDSEEESEEATRLNPLMNFESPRCSDDEESDDDSRVQADNEAAQGVKSSLSDVQMCLLDIAEIAMRFGMSKQALEEVIRWAKKSSPATIQKLPISARHFWTKFDRIFHKKKKTQDRVQCTNFTTKMGDEVTFVFMDPRTAVKRLLNNRRVTNEATLLRNYSKDGYAGRRSEVNSGDWWKRTEVEVREKYGRHINLLPLIFCADGSPTSLKGSVKPVYLSIGNVSLKARLRIDGKECLAYIPDKPFDEKDEEHQAERRRLINLGCWDVLLKKLDLDTPLTWEHDGESVQFALRVMFFLGDHPESQALAGVKGGWNCSHPCRHCLVPRDRMPYFEESFPPRTEDFRDSLAVRVADGERLKREELHSYHLDVNSATALSCFRGRYFKAFPMCVGHVFFSQGLVKKLVTFTLAAIADYGFQTSPAIRALMSSDELMGSVLKKTNTAGTIRLRELDRRMSLMPHYSRRSDDGSILYLESFRHVSKLSFITGTQYLHLLQIIPIALGSSGSFFMPEDCRLHLLRLFSVLRSIVFLVKKCHVWDAETFQRFKLQIAEFSRLMTHNSFVCMSPSQMKFSKLHVLSHLVEMVREYGAPRNLDTSTYDHAHKDSVKKAYKLSSKQETKLLKQMIVNNERLKAIALLRSQVSDPPSVAKEVNVSNRIRFPCRIGTRSINASCQGLRLDDTALFGMKYCGAGRAGWLTVAMNRLDMDAHSRAFYYKQMEERKLDVAFYSFSVLPRTDDIVVCSPNYSPKRERFDVVEIDSDRPHTYGQVRAIFSAFDSEFVLVRGLFPTFPEKFEHDQVCMGYVSYAPDQNPDGVFWDCWSVEQVKRKVFAAEDFDYEGRFFINADFVF